ncbi:hypothetical protein RP20_CCG002108 [Aedes albopictus]|nr:hypothetical protein RP20_CCG002108 [Aedes albopictus]
MEQQRLEKIHGNLAQVASNDFKETTVYPESATQGTSLPNRTRPPDFSIITMATTTVLSSNFAKHGHQQQHQIMTTGAQRVDASELRPLLVAYENC